MKVTKQGRDGILLLVFTCFLWGTTEVSAQKTAEQYIPIGKSPGISNISSIVGTIVAMDADTRNITIETGGERRILTVTQDTKIWLDRSHYHRENLTSNYAACKVGQHIEAMWNSMDPQVAVWIKLESE